MCIRDRRIQAHQKDEWRIESDRVYYDPRSDWPQFFLWEVWYAAHKVGKRRGIICNYADAEYFMPVINCVSSEVKIIAVKHSLTGAESLNTSTSRFGVSRSTLQKWLLNRNLDAAITWEIIADYGKVMQSSESLENKGIFAMCPPYPFIRFHTVLLPPWLLIRAKTRATGYKKVW